MTTTVTAPSRSIDVDRPKERSSGLAGTATLLRFMLRRDRVRLPAWTLGIAVFWMYYTRLIPQVYATQEDLDDISSLLVGPMGRLFTGPAYGFDQLTHARLVVGGYGLYALLLTALMSALLVVRHTRAEEQAGRAELVRSSVVGPRAPLAATLMVAAISNVAVAGAVALVTVSSADFDAAGSLLFAAGVGATGLAFAGLATITAQLTAFSRPAAGLAGGALGAAFVIRALGDMTSAHGNALSWLSPLAWPQQTAPFVLDRWWPLALSLGFALATAAIGYRLSARRDLGAGMFAVRPGPRRAPSWLGSPLTFTVRLQRASIIGWTASVGFAGLVFGAWTDAMLTSADDLPDVLVDVTGGQEDMAAGYLGLMALFMALIIGIYAILAIQSIRTEETTGRGDPLLAAPVSRWEWLGTHTGVTAAGVLVALAVTGVATGIGAAIVTGEASYVWEVTGAHLAYAPAVVFVLGVAALLFGVAPRLIGISWLILGYGLIIGVFGPAMGTPDWANNLSPFEHIGRMPLDPFKLVPLVILTAMASCAIALGLVTFRRREINV